MKLFHTEDYILMKNPTQEKLYRPNILTAEDKSKDLGGMFGLLEPGSRVPYHYHKTRESVLIIISGQGVEIVEGEEFNVKAGEVIFTPAGKKHAIINRSKQDLRSLEFFTCPPVGADFFEVRE